MRRSTNHLTGVVRGIPDEELARAVARQRLRSRLTDHPAGSLADCVQMGRAVGLSMSEMQRMTGLARQTLYRHLNSDEADERRSPTRPQAMIETLMLLAAEGDYASPALLGRRGNLEEDFVRGLVTDLDIEGLCTIRRDSYSALEAAPNPATFLVLREHFDDLYLRRPDGVAVYVRVPEQHEQVIACAADEIIAREEHTVMSRSVAPSTMVGPELALKVNAPTIRRALEITRDMWRDLLERVEIPYTEPVITNVIPPGAQPAFSNSAVLDAFLEAIVDAGVVNSEALRTVRSGFDGSRSEADLAGRCVTMAATALRRAVGNRNDPRLIADGDTAFAELQPAHGVPVPTEAREIKAAAVAALDLATERLGPLPGGRLGSLRAPGQAPRIVEGIEPTGSELVEMGRLSGHAVGAAAVLGVIDAAWAVTQVSSGGEKD